MLGGMIDFERVWLPQIVAYAELISAGQLQDQWLGRVGTITSVTDPDELFEQVFDDLALRTSGGESYEFGSFEDRDGGNRSILSCAARG
jgi:hypothetical protein